MKRMFIYFIIAIGVLFVAVIFFRILSGDEDTWICENGIWIKHGNPTVQMPTQECKSNEQKNICSEIDRSLKNPVCGEDNKTYYYGEKEAMCSGIKVLYNAECGKLNLSICAMSNMSSREECQKLMEQRIAFENFIKENISEISPKKEVLGGKFYITKFTWADDNNGLVDYEDGHIAFKAKFNISLERNNPKINFFEIIKE
ncbi:MAG: hypothetical protein PHH83_04705 [Patescibacteria group bacterium]|nr:hypothetical protein [Patescibacteria group bacterium]